MIATGLLVLGLAGLFCISLVLKGCLLLLGLRWAKVTDYSRGKIVLVTLLMEVCGGALLGLLEFGKNPSPLASLLLLLVSTVIWMFVSCAIIARVFRTTSIRAFLAWLVTLIPAPGMLLFVFFVFKPYVSEGYYIPANSMAPTILGEHYEGVCAECGNPNYCSVVESRYRDPEQLEPMICTKFHVTETNPRGLMIASGDRILVMKFLEPRRWDLVVFRYPENPQVNFVKRLVGLPGETITIKDGKVYANDQLLTPPEEIQGIEYTTEFPEAGEGPPVWGSAERPAVLGEEEYFMLGDFSRRAKDSRLWDQGAAGHPPYAVPKSYIIGVVTYTYWPLSRYRSFR